MKKIALALAALATGSFAFAQEVAPAKSYSVTVDFTYASEYVFRGVKNSDASFQPSVEVAYSNAYVGVWSNQSFDTGAPGSGKDFDEIDLYAGYTFAINSDWNLDGGLTRYTYDDSVASGDDADSTEAYLGLTGGSYSGFKPSFYVYHDFDNEFTTYQASAGYSIALTRFGTSLDFAATLGYITQPGEDDQFYWGAGVTLPFKLSENATLTVGGQYASIDESSLEQDHFYWTTGLTVGF